MTEPVQTEAQFSDEVAICPSCGGEVDGDRASFLDAKRTRCSRIKCIKVAEAARERAVKEGLRNSQRTTRVF